MIVIELMIVVVLITVGSYENEHAKYAETLIHEHIFPIHFLHEGFHKQIIL